MFKICFLCTQTFSVADNFKLDPTEVTLKVYNLGEIDDNPKVCFLYLYVSACLNLGFLLVAKADRA